MCTRDETRCTDSWTGEIPLPGLQGSGRICALGFRCSPRGLGLWEATGQAEGPHWWTNLCTGSLVELYNSSMTELQSYNCKSLNQNALVMFLKYYKHYVSHLFPLRDIRDHDEQTHIKFKFKGVWWICFLRNKVKSPVPSLHHFSRGWTWQRPSMLMLEL